MPIYEFACDACGNVLERLQKLSDPPPDACPKCGGKMAKIMSRNSFQLKGGGWYKDLYSSSGAKKNGEAGQGAASTPAPGGSDGAASTGGNGAGGADSAAGASKTASPAPVTPAPSAPAKKD